MIKTKPFSISRDIVQLAYLRVKENRGSAGIDGMSLEKFEKGRRENLYRLWNRMSSGSYMPLPVKLVEIPKQGGGNRPVGITTVTSRSAQLAKRRRRCITYSNGKSLTLNCTTCTYPGCAGTNTSCPHRDDDTIAVFVL